MFSVDAFHKFTPSFWSAFYQRPVRLLLTGLISLLLCWPAIAQNITSGVDEQVKKIASDIPPALQPWQAWVLAKHPNRHCPWLADGNEQQCLWVSQSTFIAANTGAEFSVDVQLYQEGWVTLPGDVRYWPQQVMVRGAQAPVSQPTLRDHAGEPQIWLQRGNWQISGHFRWSQAPQSIQIPVQSGIVALEWQQQKVSQPKRLGRQLWLQPAGQQTADVAQDQLQIQVFRLLEDQIPARMTTLLQLDVSGNSREIELTGALLPAFQALALESDLPALLNANGVLRIQLQPGRWQVELISQSSELPQSLTFPAATAPWPDTEILAFAAAPELRTIQMSGAPALDPNQTQAPAHWQQYPLYQVNAASTLQLNQQSRGASLSQDQLHLHKMAWLDFSGQHLTVSDTITGQLSSSSRLQVMQPYQLGRAELAGEPQLITQLPAQQPGVELRKNPLQLNTVSTVALPSSLPASLPISGWQARFSGVEMQLQLPPGWSLFTASGADDIQGGYIQRWSLWDIFFVLLLTTACGRMFGWKLAVLSLVCMLLLYQRAEAPQWLWLILVTLLASLKIASGRALLWLQRGSQLCAVLLFLLLLPFAVDQIRLAIYPQLEKPWHSIQYQNDAKPGSANRAAFERLERQAKERQPQVMMSDAEVPAAADSLSIAGASGSAALTETKRYRKTLSESLISASTVDLAQDPTARIQTGPARPDWQWQSVYLRWQGPVLPEEQTQLYLVPAWLNRLGAVVTVLLAFAFWWLLSRSLWQFERLSFRKAPALMSLLPALVFL
ncbi:MAG: hypothetical protein KKB00_02405, partial [Gammaproteobacteria bacterium]|nr:hypothetical protein [Gammaproteobacteria bacterium]